VTLATTYAAQKMKIGVGTEIARGEEEYYVKAVLSSGGFGTAYLAEQLKPGVAKEVVIKVPRDDILTDPVWSQKFAREARILANLSHPNIVKILDFLEFESGEKALVQELVRDARPLDAFIEAEPDTAPSLLLQALYALRHMQEGTTPAIVHRDLSPNNILVNSVGMLKVIDFGLAKEDPRATSVLTVAGQWFGTPGCVAPEQVTDAAQVDHRADQFAVGRSFAAALQGRSPMFAEPSTLPAPFGKLLARMAHHDFAARHASASDAIDHAMLEFVAHGLPVSHFDVHVREHRTVTTVCPGWVALCDHHFARMPQIETDTVRVASELAADIFADPNFDAAAFFDRLEASAAIAEYASGGLSFSAADALGALYTKLYPALDLARRGACFQRLVRTALDYHRFAVMHDVRLVYASEPNLVQKATLMATLNRLDPEAVIEGRGLLPRTP
jgi:tRNA A-37 threonylcarbamoyl transferase component Bud32